MKETLTPEQLRWHESETHRAYQGGKKVGYAEAIEAVRAGVEAGKAYEAGRDHGYDLGMRTALAGAAALPTREDLERWAAEAEFGGVRES